MSKKRMQRRQGVQAVATVLSVCVVILLVAAIRQVGNRGNGGRQGENEDVENTAVSVAQSEAPQETETPEPAVQEDPKESIYTFLQGPKSWSRGLDWSGEWGEEYMDGGYFGAFGCGLCCIANIYSSLTPYQCSPLDAYRFAKKNTEYSGGMAIEWGYLRRSMTAMGFDCHVERKPESYREFRRQMKDSLCSLVLVSSHDSSVYWKDTPGHYVTIFLYDSAEEDVFLADSGNPEHNRSRVALRKIYRSLKTASNWQYILVEGYDRKEDGWKHKKTSGIWNIPEGL